MKVKVLDKDGNFVILDNAENKNGSIEIEGYPPLKKHLDLILNEDIELIFLGKINSVPEDLRLYLPDKRIQLYTASDKYFNDYLEDTLKYHGYTVEFESL